MNLDASFQEGPKRRDNKLGSGRLRDLDVSVQSFYEIGGDSEGEDGAGGCRSHVYEAYTLRIQCVKCYLRFFARALSALSNLAFRIMLTASLRALDFGPLLSIQTAPLGHAFIGIQVVDRNLPHT